MSQEGLGFFDGYDAAIIGILEDGDGVHRVVYDKWAMVEVYMAQEPDATWEDAVEWLAYNTWGSYHGPETPICLHTFIGTAEQKRFDIEEYFFDLDWMEEDDQE